MAIAPGVAWIMILLAACASLPQARPPPTRW